jgi:UDP-N-acetylglucosamine 2-epimerase (non-hydrolysing)
MRWFVQSEGRGARRAGRSNPVLGALALGIFGLICFSIGWYSNPGPRVTADPPSKGWSIRVHDPPPPDASPTEEPTDPILVPSPNSTPDTSPSAPPPAVDLSGTIAALKGKRDPAKLNVFVLYGTRPETIKLAPVVRELRARSGEFVTTVIDVGQHTDMIRTLQEHLQLQPDLHLKVMKPGQSLNELSAKVVAQLGELVDSLQPHAVVVQGDTSTAMLGAVLTFNSRLHVVHVEAGLRTGQLQSPFPEELNRRVIGQVCTLCFAPTMLSARYLANEGLSPDRVFVVGNTVIDQLHWSVAHPPGDAVDKVSLKRLDNDERVELSETKDQILARKGHVLLVTAHRRENLGDAMKHMFEAIKGVATGPGSENLKVVFPVHANPKVRDEARAILGGMANVFLVEPVDYPYFVQVLRRVTLVLTDSGGIQEEAVSLGIPTLVARTTTERQEGVIAGVTKLVGTESASITREIGTLMSDSGRYNAMAHASNPFGDGQSSKKIVATMANERDRLRRVPDTRNDFVNVASSSTGLTAAGVDFTNEVGHNAGRKTQLGTVTVVLNAFKRDPRLLERQIELLEAQTMRPASIVVWQNENHVDLSGVLTKHPQVKHVHSKHWNMRFHGRFLLALMIDTEFVAYADDDAMPGKNWLRTATNLVQRENSLVGTECRTFEWPAVMNPSTPYLKVHEFVEPRGEGQPVDFVGHWWVMKSAWSHWIWSMPHPSFYSAEDASISALLQMRGNIGTYCYRKKGRPTDDQPELNLDSVVSDKSITNRAENVASWRDPNAQTIRMQIFRYWLRQGWVPLKQLAQTNK